MKDRVKVNILNILSKEYGVDEEDFLSAEIEVVPAGAARDYGFDRSMIMDTDMTTECVLIRLLRQCLRLKSHSIPAYVFW